MPKGYRYIVLAALGWLTPCLANPTSQNTKGGPSANNPSPEPTQTELPYRAYSERNSNACYKAKPHDTADLCAQWRSMIAAEESAKAANTAVLLTVVATVLSAFGLGFLAVSLRQTGSALNEARRGNRYALLSEKRARREARGAAADTSAALREAARNADAAADMARIAEQTAQRELRAYVDIENIQWGRDASRDREGYEFAGIKVDLRNFGKTPAREVEIKASYGVVIRSEYEPIAQDPTFKTGLGGISPSDSMIFRDFFEWPIPMYEEALGNKWKLQVAIVISYTDAFEQPRSIEVTYISNGLYEFGFLPGTRRDT